MRARGLRAPDGARLVQATVQQARDGWNIAVQIEAAAPAYAQPTAPVVGIDVGLNSLITLADGTKIPMPKLAKKRAGRLRRSTGASEGEAAQGQ
jgi:transposase